MKLLMLIPLTTFLLLPCQFFTEQYATDQSSDLSTALENFTTCNNPCWLGIEIKISTEADVQTSLEANDIQFEVVDVYEGLRVYNFEFENNEGSIWINPTIDIVGRIDVPMDLCLDNLLFVYGEPKVNVHVGYLELFYPEHGLIFYFDTDEQNIWAVTLLTKAYLVDEYMLNLEIQDWEAVDTEIQSCS